ncbi:MAG: hypothetical protein ACW981_03125 [Candidatus Hodarchaeales archaeon]
MELIIISKTNQAFVQDNIEEEEQKVCSECGWIIDITKGEICSVKSYWGLL